MKKYETAIVASVKNGAYSVLDEYDNAMKHKGDARGKYKDFIEESNSLEYEEISLESNTYFAILIKKSILKNLGIEDIAETLDSFEYGVYYNDKTIVVLPFEDYYNFSYAINELDKLMK